MFITYYLLKNLIYLKKLMNVAEISNETLK